MADVSTYNKQVLYVPEEIAETPEKFNESLTAGDFYVMQYLGKSQWMVVTKTSNPGIHPLFCKKAASTGDWEIRIFSKSA